MHIVVLAKVVPDYEVPAADFELSGNRAHSRYNRMIGLYDENAIEVGVQLKETYGASMTIVSYGRADDIPALRKAIAMGGEKLILVEGASDDPAVIAGNLKAAVASQPEADLILAGLQSADMDRGLVPGLLAGVLNCRFIPQVSRIEKTENGWRANQITEKGQRAVRFDGPAVLSVTSVPGNVPRIPAVRDIFSAKKKPVEIMKEIHEEPMALEELAVWTPKMESVCEFFPAEKPEETARLLMRKLHEGRYL